MREERKKKKTKEKMKGSVLIKVGRREKKEEEKGRNNYRMEGKGREKKVNQSVLSPWLELAVCNSVVCVCIPPCVTSHTG